MSRIILAVGSFAISMLFLSDAARAQVPITVLDEPGAINSVDEMAPATSQSCMCSCRSSQARRCSSCCGRACGKHQSWLAGGHVQMYPHYPYFPAMHGYYYFRPYNYTHLKSQQEIVAGWGGDPTNPYDNRIFQEVYARHEFDKM